MVVNAWLPRLLPMLAEGHWPATANQDSAEWSAALFATTPILFRARRPCADEIVE